MPAPDEETERLRRELAEERAAHDRTLARLAEVEARARAWRRVARWIYEAHRDTCADT